MNGQELIERIRFAGRYEIISDGDGNYVCLPVPVDAVLIAPDSHVECGEFFRTPED